MKFSAIFLDMDGVLSNFHLDAVRSHIKAGRRLPHIHTGGPLELGNHQLVERWPRGLSLQKYMANGGPPITGDEFWEPIRKDPLFWRVIPPYANYKELVDLLRPYCDDLVLLTAPDKTAYSHSGKREWLAIHGLADLEYITARRKWRLADPTCLIIDDFEEHTKAWRRELYRRWGIDGPLKVEREGQGPCGVHAILYPQPWNSNHHLYHEQLPFVERTIKFYLEQYV